MTPRQKEILYERTGFREPESFLDSLRDDGNSTFTIEDGDNKLWESGFAVFAMENYEFSNTAKGVIIEL